MPAPYTPYYCEENVVQHLQYLSLAAPASSLFAAFISNPSRRALLFQQRASKAGTATGHHVLWDYHVVALQVWQAEDESRRVVEILDRDSRLGDRVPLEKYVSKTFRPDLFEEDILDPSLRSRVRLVPAVDLLANFASDRSHMLVPPSIATDVSPLLLCSAPPASPSSASSPSSPSEPQYLQPVPPYPPIQGPGAKNCGETHNLWTRWLDTRMPHELAEGERQEKGFGVVLERVEDLLTYPWIEPPTRFRPDYRPSHLVTPDYLTILSPSLSESLSAFSASVRVDVDMHVERIDLSPSTHLTIDNVSGLVSELAHSDPTSTPTALCNNFAWLTYHHRQPVRLHVKNLLLRPVVMKKRDRLEVHFEFRAAALSTAMKLCESGEVRKLR
ncbi:hypothetical protein JCM11641_002203 [Rhodosporidiobolus odoratus]